MWRSALTRSVVVLAICLVSSPVAAQWLDQPTKGLPRTPDGKPVLSAPTPRTLDGRPDLSGIWLPMPDPDGRAGGVEGIVAPKYMIDVMRDFAPSQVPFRPWGEALYTQRNNNSRLDNPSIRCLPNGVPRLNAYTHPYKIVQTADLIVILYEAGTMFRQIFLDGRGHPKEQQPAWLGYSIGRWDGDTLVIETVGFNGQTWLDGAGHPQSEEMRLTERFTRHTVGRMDIQIVLDDPKAYTKPVSYVQPQSLLPDTELIEFFCAENAKPVGGVR
jgi:hypothetical protein